MFLSKHPTADFYVMPYRYLPADLGTDAGKKELEQVKKFATVLADPMKGLRSDTAAVRAETALLLVTKYRTAPTLAPKIEQVLFAGVTAGTAVMADGKTTPLPLFKGMPAYDPAALPGVASLKFAKAPARAMLAGKK